MMPEEWPIAAAAADPPLAAVRATAGARLATVRADFFLDPAARLNEQERALMHAMLDDLLATVADEIVAALPPALQAMGEEGHPQLVERLKRSGLLDRPALIAMLLRVADEQRLHAAAQLRPPAAVPLLQRWVADPDGDIAAGAMALVIARGRRRDRFGRARILFDDLPAEEAVALVYAVAAALRESAGRDPDADRLLTAAADRLLARHDEGLRMDAQVSGFVRLLERAERLKDDLVADAAAEGEIALLSAVLARRAGVPETFAWEHLIAGGEGRLVSIARLAGVQRPAAARLIADLGDLTGIADAAAEMRRFDAMTTNQVEALRAEWRLPTAYRDARERLGG